MWGNRKCPPQAPAPGGQNFPQAYTSGNLDHECHSALAPPPASGQSMSQVPTGPNHPPPQPIVPTGLKHHPPQAMSHSGGHTAPQALAESHCHPPPPGTNFDCDRHSQAPGLHTGSQGASTAPEHCPPQNLKHAPSDMDADGDGWDEPTDKQHQSGSCGRLKDYAGIKKSLLKWAGEAYKVLMAIDGMYETNVDVLDQHQCEAWQMALDRYEVNKADYPLMQAHVQSLIDWVISWHGDAHKQVKDHVTYNFFSKKVMKMLKTPEELNAYIKKLKNGGLHMKLCMDNILFQHHKDLGVLFIEKFRQP
ncbi:hypothetical protein FRC11_000709 [Ceratobasidium sp. 423]|nr:hypothetical protein FRC11_000709 [Ceratobasidium sp. 423]